MGAYLPVNSLYVSRLAMTTPSVMESTAVIVLALVVAERLLIQVAEQMEGL
jgi:hypothetical protein